MAQSDTRGTETRASKPAASKTQALSEAVSRKSVPVPAARRQRVLLALVAVAMIAGAALFVVREFPGLRLPGNPFGERTTDRSQPVLLQAVRDISRYHAAVGEFEVIIDLERDAKFVPSVILGERVLFVAAGSVDAYVDFTGLAGDAVTVSADRKQATVRLPRASLAKANLDHSRSYVVASRRGIVDHLQRLLGDSGDTQQRIYVLAEKKIGDAAHRAKLEERAEQNTRAMLTGLLTSLGYETVTVTFGPDPV